MNVVDSFAWLEYLADGPDAAIFAKPIEATRSLIVPTLSLFEVFRRVSQHAIALAESVMLASAHRQRATLWSQDSDFDGLPAVRYYAKR